MAYIPMGQASSVDPGTLRQQLMAQLLQGRQPADTLGGAVGQGLQTLAQGLGGRWQIDAAESAQQAQQQALIDQLTGTPGKPGMGATLPGDTGGLQGMTRGPATPGLMPELSREQATAMSLMPGGREMLLKAMMERMLPTAGEGFTLGENQVRYGPDGKPIASGPAGAAKPPQTRDVLQGGERVFQQYDPATGQWAEVGRGPAFAPPSQVNVNTEKAPNGYWWVDENDHSKGVKPLAGGPAEQIQGPTAAVQSLVPGALAEVPMLEEALFPGGQYSPRNAGMMNAPMIGAVPGTAGVGNAAAMQSGTMAILRGESGGAITDEEIANKLSTYMPGPLDPPDVARQKFERYKRDLQNTLRSAEQGRTAAPTATAPPPAANAPSAIESIISSGVEGAQGLVQGALGAVSGAMAPAPAAEQTATNPQTGEKVVLRNGQWVPF